VILGVVRVQRSGWRALVSWKQSVRRLVFAPPHGERRTLVRAGKTRTAMLCTVCHAITLR